MIGSTAFAALARLTCIAAALGAHVSAPATVKASSDAPQAAPPVTAQPLSRKDQDPSASLDPPLDAAQAAAPGEERDQPGASAAPRPSPASPPAYVPRPGTTEEVPRAPAGPSLPGYIINSSEGDRLTVGGYIHTDGRLYVGDGSSSYVNQILLRQVRPVLEGTIRDHIDFRLLPDLAGGKVVVQEAWVDLRYSRVLKLRVGKFKEPVSLERIQNSNAVIFAGRALPTNIAPDRNVGAELFGDIGDVASYEIGIFDGTVDNGVNPIDSDTSGGKEGAGRLFFLPFATTRWAHLKGLGVGISGSWANPKGTSAGPQLATAVSTAQNTIFSYAAASAGASADPASTAIADGEHLRWDLQGYYYWGPVGIQSEYIGESQRLRKGTNVVHAINRAFEVTGSFVLTGEKATFRMLVPDHPLDPALRQFGAFEVTARYHQIRFDDILFEEAFADAASVRGANAWGIGLNWYVDRALRFMFNFDRTDFIGGPPAADRPPEQVFIARVQTVF